jgi:pimeloyl-ACP methyl ester carboxylesterase
MVEVVIDFAETIIPSQQFVIIGESYGGYLARGIVHHMPARVDGLFLWTPATYPRSERKRPEPVVRIKDDRVAAGLTTTAEKELFGLFVVQSQEAMDFARAHILPGWEIADEKFLERVIDTRFSFDLHSQIFEKPTHILCGRQDAVVGYEEAYEALGNFPLGTMVIVDGAGHTLGFTEGERLFKASVNAWLDSLGHPE